jgi:hypothetical protein
MHAHLAANEGVGLMQSSDMLHTFAGGCEEEELPAQLTSRPEIFGTPGRTRTALSSRSVSTALGR